MRTLAMQAPPTWQPPATWTPPQHFPARSVPLEYTPRQSSRGRTLVLVLVGLVALVGLVPAIVVPLVLSRTTETVDRTIQVGQRSGQPFPGVPTPGDLDVGLGGGVSNQPIECQGSGQVVRLNESIDVQGPHAVVASGSCVLRLVNCNLRGGGLSVSGDAQVDVMNGSIDAAGTAVTASGQARVRLTNTNVSSKDGIQASGTADVMVVNGTLRAEGVAVDAREEATVATQNTRIEGSVSREPTATVTVNGVASE